MALALVCALVPAALAATPASAVQTPQPKVVSDDPVNWTPHVLDGRVKAIVQAGDTVILGGAFTQVSSADGATILNRSNIVAFNAKTGAISTTFAPQVDGEVTALVVSDDGRSVFAGGFFNTVNSQPAKSLAKIDLSNGQLTPEFITPAMDGRVKDLKLAAGRLWVAGHFGYVGGKKQPALVTLNPTTGAFDTFNRVVFDGPLNDSVLQVLKMDITPDGSRLVAIGNFSTVQGQPRVRLAVLDLTGSEAQVADWQTDFFAAACSASFDTYMRDLDISPDGSYFVVSTTGAYRAPPSPCDTTSRWELGARGSGLSATWVDYTGGDTTYAVAITGTAVYVGGHMRWQNNPSGNNRAAAGAVSREGIAALDPATGLPLRWNPGRTRGVGVFDMLATPDGLWVGSDTDRIGNWEYHARIAYLPVAGGTEVPNPSVAALPGDVHLVPSSGTSPVKRSFDGTTVGSTGAVPSGGISWQNVKQGFMLGDQLYSGWSDGTFTRRGFDGTTYDAPMTINTADQLVADSVWHQDVANLTGMFWSGGRLYYTRSGASALYYRYFTVESDVVGAQRFTASASITDVDFSRVSGMFVVGDKLYWASSADGNLRRVDFVDGKPVAGTVRVLSGPTVDGNDWRSRAMYVFTRATPPPNQPPVATITNTCTNLACEFGSAGSYDPDGTIASYAWDFGDGATASGPTASHTYPASGTYPVRLTVTDDDGAKTSTEVPVTVRRPNQAPTASFTVECDDRACSVNGSGSKDPDGTIASYAWNFGDGATGSGATASHTYAADGAYTVRLTVTDNEGAIGQIERRISVAASGTSVRFVAQAGANGNLLTHKVTIPTSVAAGDRLLLLLTINSTTPTISAPSGVTGWSGAGAKSTSSMVSRAWQKKASATDAGATVNVTLSAYAKGDLTLVAYRGPNVILRTSTSAAETTSQTTHKTPTLTGDASSWLVSYWGEKSSSAAGLTAPTGQTVRRTGTGTGSGRIAALLTDSGRTLGTGGTAGGLTATADTASAQATMWSFLIGPTP
ncbi:PKD domain-containing protein [Actinopolymorpha alba]|uniref:PKD domain-containing protein n=1 Tax=Actinopolymorpha alba TaxID=533267 RepID=UPI00036E3942|nr:PKD domain-containing protein [Actinopolymorpha alba]